MSYDDLPLFAEPSPRPQATILCDDVLAWAEKYDGPPFHALLADAPYSLGDGKKGFMSKSWDNNIAFKPDTWKALAQHLLPGAFGMCFGSARGFHRLMVAIEDAGLIIHPAIFNWRSGQMIEVPSLYGWNFASGFPKATRIDSQIDRAMGAEREVLGTHDTRGDYDGKKRTSQAMNTSWRQAEGRLDIRDLSQKVITAPATPLAQTWAGHRYGLQALKPAIEPIILFSKTKGSCYNDLQELIDDCSGLLDDLWIRFANTAECISKVETIVNTILSNAQNRHDQTCKANGSTADTVGSLSIKPQESYGPIPASAEDIAQDHVIAPIGQSLQSDNANGAVIHSSLDTPTMTENIANTSVLTPQENAPCSPIRCETETDIDIRMAILRYNSERAKFDLSTIWLWRITWDAIWSEENRSTTVTIEKMITVLRTLSSELRRLMFASRDIASTKNSSTNLWSYASDVNCRFIGLLNYLTVSEPTAHHASLSPIIVFQKPYAGKPVQSITQTGAGALWIEGSRVDGKRWAPNFALCHTEACARVGERQVKGTHPIGPNPGCHTYHDSKRAVPSHDYTDATGHETVDAWDCAPGCPVKSLDDQAGERPGGHFPERQMSHPGAHGKMRNGGWSNRIAPARDLGDNGGPSRFFHVSDYSLDVAERLAQADPVFYAAKASRLERDSGLNGQRNPHPTVKPALTLCKWLATLLLPPAAYAPRRLLVPFAGVASEIVGAMLAGWEEIVGIESDPSYVEIARQRLAYWQQHPKIKESRCP